MRFRLVWYDTKEQDRYESEKRYEFLGNRESIWKLWHTLNIDGNIHIEVYSLDGRLQEPEKGYAGMLDYNL